MNRETNRIDRISTRRVYMTFAVFLLAAVVIVGRLAKLQIKDHDYYEAKVLNQLTRDTNVNPERGNIMDRDGNILATNKTVYNVILSPHDIQEHMKDDEKKNMDDNADNDVRYTWEDTDYQIFYSGTKLDDLIAEVLSGYLGSADRTNYRSTVYEKAHKLDRYYEMIEKNVEEDIADKIESFIAKYNLGKEVYFLRSFLQAVLPARRPRIPCDRVHQRGRRGRVWSGTLLQQCARGHIRALYPRAGCAEQRHAL